MNAFFVRLALLGSRNAWGRPAGIAAGIAIGTAIFLLLLGAFNALDARAGRGAWVLGEGTTVDAAGGRLPDGAAAVVASGPDYYRGNIIARLDIAPVPGATFPIPGVGAAPAPGTYLASAALAALIAAAPAEELGARYGTPAGLIPNAALVGPDSLFVIVGWEPGTLTGQRTRLVADLESGAPEPGTVYQIVLGIGAIGLFFPVVLFVSIVTRLGAAARRERFATLRLLGASPRQVGRIAGLETLVTSSIGALTGIVLAILLRPLAARIPLNGGSFFPADLAVGALPTLAAAVAMIVVATLATAIGIRRAGITPLGASRQMRERQPRARRALVLLTGLLLLAAPRISMTLGIGAESVLLLMAAFLGGFFLTTLGIVLIGPWLTFRLSALVSRAARGAAGVIAGNRIRATPGATFRAVSGLVVAVFMVSVFAGAAGGVLQGTMAADVPDRLPPDALIATIGDGIAPESLASAVAEVPGVTGVVLGYDPDAFAPFAGGEPLTGVVIARADAVRTGFAAASEAPFAAFSRSALLAAAADLDNPLVPALLRAGAAPLAEMIVVRTDGSAGAIERARTALLLASGGTVLARTRVEGTELGDRRLMRELAFVAYLGAFFSIGIAGCSLAIATAGGMIDRRRVLGLMRLMGMPASQLRRIVGFEAAVPLVAVLVVSAGLGLFVAWLILTTLSADIPFAFPEPAYFITLAVGLLLALVAVTSTFGMIRRNTAIGATRFE